MGDPAELLHPTIRHHIVNTLGWRELRPLQQATIRPVTAGDNALLRAPTAGGKTEAAAFPIVTRIATEHWQPTSVLYLAPLRALINNLVPRLEQYAGFTGHRAAPWHGDVGHGDRQRIISDPPDILLTTPESLEAILISRRTDEREFFRNIRSVVIDEVHAFAASDRGWHLMAVLERLTRICGRPIQRLGLSATVGNPDQLLTWMTRGSPLPGSVINPDAPAIESDADVKVDYVGSQDNAAELISRNHLGEKRLVFVDSRKGAEELTAALRRRDVLTFVSHGSLGRDERRQTEEAFAQAANCVIVATSTLELGIDIGDLDRVIQLNAPSTVASFLQRLGRTGRRPGTQRNTLFLVVETKALLPTLGLVRAWKDGYVEPATPPPFPAHMFAQQVLALALQEHRTSTDAWRSWLGDPHVFGPEIADLGPQLVEHLLAAGMLFSDGGVIGMGDEGEATFGAKNFIDLMGSFLTPPEFTVRAGRNDIGVVPQIALAAANDNGGRMLLAGRHWFMLDVDWNRRVIHVEPIPDGGRVQFQGGTGALGYEICQAAQRVLCGEDPGVELTSRATRRLAEQRDDFGWLEPGRTKVVFDDLGRTRWWTFGGLHANLELAARISEFRTGGGNIDNFGITIDQTVDSNALRSAARRLGPTDQAFVPDPRMVEGLKFNEALPDTLAAAVVQRRLGDPNAISELLT